MSLDNNNDVMDMTTAEETALYQKLNDGYGETRDELNQLIGQIQMAEAFAKMSDVVCLQKLQYIKEHKLYKALKGRPLDIDGEKRPMVGTFEEFCKLIGTSKSTVEERLQNANQFGIEAAETFERIGVSTKSLRLARKLPEDEQALIAEYTSKPEVTKDDVQQLINELDEKHKAELARKEADIKSKLTEIDSLKSKLNTSRELHINAQSESEELKVKLAEKRLKTNDYSGLTQEIKSESMLATQAIVNAAAKMRELANQLISNEHPQIEKALELAIPDAYHLFLDSLQRAAAMFDEFDHLLGGYAEQPRMSFNLIKQLAADPENIK